MCNDVFRERKSRETPHGAERIAHSAATNERSIALGGFMDKPTTNTAPENDILHSESQSKLSAADIAKAVAHHNHHHPEKPQQDATAKPKPGKKA